MLCLSVCVQVRLLEIVSGTKIAFEVIECVAIFCRLIVLGMYFWVLLRSNFLVIFGLTGCLDFRVVIGYCDSDRGRE